MERYGRASRLKILVFLISFVASACKGERSAPPPAAQSPKSASSAVATPKPPEPAEGAKAQEEKSTEFEIDGDANTYVGPAPLPVEFTMTETNAKGPVKYEWDFGDGSPRATGKDQKHTYDKPGTFVVRVVATDSSGAFDHMNFLLTVLSEAEWKEFAKRVGAAEEEGASETSPAPSPEASSE